MQVCYIGMHAPWWFAASTTSLSTLGISPNAIPPLDPHQKVGKGYGHDTSQKKTFMWPTTYEKKFHITDHQRNANQNHNKIPSHTSQNGNY